jgi:hypothetical protein
VSHGACNSGRAAIMATELLIAEGRRRAQRSVTVLAPARLEFTNQTVVSHADFHSTPSLSWKRRPAVRASRASGVHMMRSR